jgi:aminoglycoside phosphotransferase family enzyme
MLDADTYPHEVDALELIETHLSWVFLTGAYVYKVKKPVNFDFVDFSTLALRRHFCEEEVRCNRGFAPDLLSVVEMRAFGRRLASQHAGLPVLDMPYDPGEAMVENFATLKALPCTQPWRDQIAALEHQTEMQLAVNSGFLHRRRQEDHVRECHGDLHLSNLARLQDGITAFDCLEFDVDLRNIDVWCDAAFLFMDCAVRGCAELGYAFVDGYLDESGDYDGVALLPMFAAYRSVVRAKIAALRFEQSADAASRQKLATHLTWPLDQYARPTGNLYITCGLSGSGKSFWADQLVPEIQSLRLRSDVMRKSQHGLAPLDLSDSAVGGGLYA